MLKTLSTESAEPRKGVVEMVVVAETELNQLASMRLMAMKVVIAVVIPTGSVHRMRPN